MQDQRVIFPNDEGGVSIIVPAPGVTLEQVLLAVPDGKPYKIVDAADIPSDRSERDAWVVDEADLTDGVGGVSSEFEVKP